MVPHRDGNPCVTDELRGQDTLGTRINKKRDFRVINALPFARYYR